MNDKKRHSEETAHECKEPSTESEPKHESQAEVDENWEDNRLFVQRMVTVSTYSES